MIWLTWRQFRGQALVALVALGALAIYLVILGLQLRGAYDTNVGCTGCSAGTGAQLLKDKYFSALLLTGFLIILIPAVIGAFWGAPLIARELEAGTHRLVWNQSITRTRWLAVKLSFVTLAALAFTGILSLLFTWAASPYDRAINDRFDPLFFPTRNLAPLGYAVFAVVAGITIGLLTKRTVIAMAVTLAVFTAIQILMPTVIRPHLAGAVTENVQFTAGGAHGMWLDQTGRVSVDGYDVPGAWMLTSEAILVDSTGGQPGKAVTEACFNGDFEKDKACLEALNLHSVLTYQPADRYWTFQWLEFGIYLLLALLLAGYAFWRIPRGLS
ncbi:ABC transporter permease subunit [Actinoplanes sp. NPDC048967]|uniref:ABC transporter permease subunit n=1 Tax=Actinoplanes sp. NPDC048967 TaxID=3155269 RepID=UPI0034044B26